METVRTVNNIQHNIIFAKWCKFFDFGSSKKDHRYKSNKGVIRNQEKKRQSSMVIAKQN